MSTPRAFTAEEMRKKFLDHICNMIGYWNSEGQSNVPKDMTTLLLLAISFKDIDVVIVQTVQVGLSLILKKYIKI